MFMFQLPGIPERVVTRRGFAKQAFRGWAVHKENFADEDLARLEEAIQKPGAMTGGVNYYRAALRNLSTSTRLPIINCPTLVIWGMQDRALDSMQLEGLEAFARDVRIYRVPDASHWVQQDAPETVNRELLAFLKG